MAEVCTLDWHIAPFRADRWLDLWEPAAARMPAFGAKSWSLTRSIDDPLAFQQTSVWESRSDFERYWYSEEIEAARAGDHRPLRPADPAGLAHARRGRVDTSPGRAGSGQRTRQEKRRSSSSGAPARPRRGHLEGVTDRAARCL